VTENGLRGECTDDPECSRTSAASLLPHQFSYYRSSAPHRFRKRVATLTHMSEHPSSLHLGRPTRGRVGQSTVRDLPFTTTTEVEMLIERREWGEQTLKQACFQEYPEAQHAFKNIKIHGNLQFTFSIAFRCVLHRCENQDIHC
jgi:hypothetical protein